MLQTLPEDVLLLVLSEIHVRRDVKHLCETSKFLYNFAIPKLYETIIIDAIGENQLERLNIDPFVEPSALAKGNLAFVKHVEVRSKYHRVLEDRCAHYKDLEEHLSSLDIVEDTKFGELTFDLLLVLQAILRFVPPHSLRSFVWNLGICVPAHIISGDLGHLNLFQSSLESISIDTGIRCPFNFDTKHPVSLSEFKNLRSISWAGYPSDFDIETLKETLGVNRGHLKELNLEFCDWDEDTWLDHYTWTIKGAEMSYPSNSNFLACHLFQHVNFHNLERLRLTYVRLENAGHELVHVFNGTRLRELRIWRCTGTASFLNALHAAKPSSLERLEVERWPGRAEDILDNLTILLGPIARNLNDLFVSVSDSLGPVSFWRQLRESKAPVPRFVYHHRRRTDGTGSVDNLALLTPSDIDELANAGLHHPFAELKLECLGLGCWESNIRPAVLPFLDSRTLKILHVRRSGVDLRINGALVDTNAEENPYFSGSVESEGISTETFADALSILSLWMWDKIPPSNTPPKRKFCSSTGESYGFDIGEFLDMITNNRDLIGFINWVFGPEGIPSLEVLAFGDFSYNGRYEKDNSLFCRHHWTFCTPEVLPLSSDINIDEFFAQFPLAFRPLVRKDAALWDLVSQNMDFLGACPTEPTVAE